MSKLVIATSERNNLLSLRNIGKTLSSNTSVPGQKRENPNRRIARNRIMAILVDLKAN